MTEKEFLEETGLADIYLEQPYTFGKTDRNPIMGDFHNEPGPRPKRKA